MLNTKNVNLSIEEIIDIATKLNNAGNEEIFKAERENVSGDVSRIDIYWDYKKHKSHYKCIPW